MKVMRLLVLVLVTFSVVAMPVMAQPPVEEEAQVKVDMTSGTFVFSGKAIGVGLGVAITIVGAGFGFGRIGAAALEGMARQPEVATNIQTGMIIIAALLEGATFFSLIVCLLMALGLGGSTL